MSVQFISLIIFCAIIFSCIHVYFPHWVVNLYTQDTVVQTIALQLLFFAAIFQISDGIQVAAAASLRGIKDTKFLMYATIIAFWLFGFAASWWFCFEKGMGAVGLWVGLIMGLSVVAVLNLIRFHIKTKI